MAAPTDNTNKRSTADDIDRPLRNDSELEEAMGWTNDEHDLRTLRGYRRAPGWGQGTTQRRSPSHPFHRGRPRALPTPFVLTFRSEFFPCARQR